ncbi:MULTISPECIES: peptidoglycan-binding protein [unclassified Frankia]|uniref:peptidoglycan-binding domain-containing protein n=1 Tax=unclassified Frankia TaxID=2632575 RepID=UPI001EF49166|nr:MULTISPECIES: peptidoglycan-binding protein [unclassified Frankia]
MALTWPMQKNGKIGEAVRTVQYLLRAHGYTVAIDGNFGPRTETAVREFQSLRGLTTDGAVGDQTWPSLIITVREGDRSEKGDAVRAVQDQANFRTGDPAHPFPVDGIFGPLTDAWVRGFQRSVGSDVDGIVGAVTWNHLVKEELNI